MAHKELESLILRYLGYGWGLTCAASLAHHIGDPDHPVSQREIRHALVRLEMRREVTVTDTPTGVVWSL
jgi:hypothetical protein